MKRKQIVRERGQGIIEFAVIFPIFAFLLFAVIDGGLVMGRYNQANQAAGVGARLAATGASIATVRARVDDQMHGELNPTNCSGGGDRICVAYRPGPDGQASGDVGSIVVVYVRSDYNLLTPLPGSGDWTIEACSIQRVERPVSSTVNENVSACF